MSNVKKVRRAPIKLELDKERSLKYTLNSYAEMETRYTSVDAALKAMEGGSITAVRFMLWLGLVAEDKTLTEMQVGEMIELDDLEYIAHKMQEAMTADLPADGPKALPNA